MPYSLGSVQSLTRARIYLNQDSEYLSDCEASESNFEQVEPTHERVGALWSELKQDSDFNPLGISNQDTQSKDFFFKMRNLIKNPEIRLVPSLADPGIYFVITANSEEKDLSDEQLTEKLKSTIGKVGSVLAVFKVGKLRAQTELLVRQISSIYKLDKVSVPGCIATIQNPYIPAGDTLDKVFKEDLWSGRFAEYQQIQPFDNEFDVPDTYITGILEEWATEVPYDITRWAEVLSLALITGVRDGKEANIGLMGILDAEEAFPSRLDPLPNEGVNPKTSKAYPATQLPFIDSMVNRVNLLPKFLECIRALSNASEFKKMEEIYSSYLRETDSKKRIGLLKELREFSKELKATSSKLSAESSTSLLNSLKKNLVNEMVIPEEATLESILDDIIMERQLCSILLPFSTLKCLKELASKWDEATLKEMLSQKIIYRDNLIKLEDVESESVSETEDSDNEHSLQFDESRDEDDLVFKDESSDESEAPPSKVQRNKFVSKLSEVQPYYDASNEESEEDILKSVDDLDLNVKEDVALSNEVSTSRNSQDGELFRTDGNLEVLVFPEIEDPFKPNRTDQDTQVLSQSQIDATLLRAKRLQDFFQSFTIESKVRLEDLAFAVDPHYKELVIEERVINKSNEIIYELEKNSKDHEKIQIEKIESLFQGLDASIQQQMKGKLTVISSYSKGAPLSLEQVKVLLLKGIEKRKPSRGLSHSLASPEPWEIQRSPELETRGRALSESAVTPRESSDFSFSSQRDLGGKSPEKLMKTPPTSTDSNTSNSRGSLQRSISRISITSQNLEPIPDEMQEN